MSTPQVGRKPVATQMVQSNHKPEPLIEKQGIIEEFQYSQGVELFLVFLSCLVLYHITTGFANLKHDITELGMKIDALDRRQSILKGYVLRDIVKPDLDKIGGASLFPNSGETELPES